MVAEERLGWYRVAQSINPAVRSSPRPDTTAESSQAGVARCYAYPVERRRLREQERPSSTFRRTTAATSTRGL
jgi:hypothetical protein